MPSLSEADRKTLARLRREEHLADLRDGRRRVATRIESRKRHQRHAKHRNRPDY